MVPKTPPKRNEVNRKPAWNTDSSVRHPVVEERPEIGRPAPGRPSGSSSGSSDAKWRKQSQQLRAAMRAARGAPPSPGEPEIEVEDDRVPCRRCGRCFDAGRVERHEESCVAKPRSQSVNRRAASPNRSGGKGKGKGGEKWREESRQLKQVMRAARHEFASSPSYQDHSSHDNGAMMF